MKPGCGTMSLHSTTRAEGLPSRVLVASTMEFALGCRRAAQASASQPATTASGSAGRGSARSSRCSGMADNVRAFRCDCRATARMEPMIRFLLKWGGIVFGCLVLVALLLFAAAWTITLRDEPLTPEAQTLLVPAPNPYRPEDNIYLA